MAHDEGELVGRAIRGDADALGVLLERHGPEVMAGLSIAPKWQSVVTPEDIMQVTYLEAFPRITDFAPTGPGAFVGWLRRIADNNLRDAVKELSRAKRPQPDRRVTAAGNNPAWVLCNAGETEEALAIGARALADRRATLPPEHLDVASSCYVVGNIQAARK